MKNIPLPWRDVFGYALTPGNIVLSVLFDKQAVQLWVVHDIQYRENGDPCFMYLENVAGELKCVYPHNPLFKVHSNKLMLLQVPEIQNDPEYYWSVSKLAHKCEQQWLKGIR